jgi:hypothetical protein
MTAMRFSDGVPMERAAAHIRRSNRISSVSDCPPTFSSNPNSLSGLVPSTLHILSNMS